MDSDPVSVVIDSPSIDLDSYTPFNNELFDRTLNEILSDEASFESSFDEYNDNQSTPSSMDGNIVQKNQTTMGKQVGVTKDTSRLSSGQNSKHKYEGTKRHINLIGTDDEDEGITENSHPKRSRIESDTGASRTNKDDSNIGIAEEDIVFGTLESNKRDWLVYFIANHIFMRERQYPVHRSARRGFVRDLKNEALSIGVDKATIGRITKYAKKLYLELVGKGNFDLGGPKYGDEINDISRDKKKMAEQQKNRCKNETNSSVEQIAQSLKNDKSDLYISATTRHMDTMDRVNDTLKGKEKICESKKQGKRKQNEDKESTKKACPSKELSTDKNRSKVSVHADSTRVHEVIDLEVEGPKKAANKLSTPKRTAAGGMSGPYKNRQSATDLPIARDKGSGNKKSFNKKNGKQESKEQTRKRTRKNRNNRRVEHVKKKASNKPILLDF